MNLEEWLDRREGNKDAEDKTEDGNDGNLESPKKVYKEIEDTARHLSILSSKCLKVDELFSSDLIEIRLKLQGLCELLVTKYSPKLYGACAREKLWKYVFYDTVQRARKLRKDRIWTSLQLAYLKTHIESGISKLHSFIMKIQSCESFYELPLISHPTFMDSVWNEGNCLIQKSRDMKEEQKKTQNKLVEVLAMCYINIGDLYRYLKDIYGNAEADNGNDYFQAAEVCYTQAFLMNPSSGLSLNQLGNIYSDRNLGIDSTYYLLYSSLTENPYEGALPNLKQHLDGKLVQFARRPALPEPRPLELVCNGFIRLLHQFLFDEVTVNFEKFCQQLLSNFHERLSTSDADLDDQLLFKLSSISVMLVWRLQTMGSSKTSPAVAFAMSVFFTLVSQLGCILKEHTSVYKYVEAICEKEIDEASTASSSNTSYRGEEVTTSAKGLVPQGPRNKRKVQKSKDHGVGRGPRFRSHSIPSLRSLDSEDMESHDEDGDRQSDRDGDEYGVDELWSEETESASESDCSNAGDERNCDSAGKGGPNTEKLLISDTKVGVKPFDSSSSSNARSSNCGSGENSQKSNDNEDCLNIRKDTLFDNSFGKEVSVAETERIVIEPKDLVACRSKIEPIIVALMPFCKWLETTPAVKDALAANAEKVFLEKLCEILTIFTSNNWADVLIKEGKTRNQRLVDDWKNLLQEGISQYTLFGFQLPEDRSMLGMSVLSNFFSSLQISDDLSENDEFVIRIGRFVSFGIWMTNTESFSMMYAPADGNKFFVPSAEMLKVQMSATKIRQLLNGNENSKRLSRAYQKMKLNDDPKRRCRGRGCRRRLRRRHESGPDISIEGRGREGRRVAIPKIDDKPICVVIDLDAGLKYLSIIRKLSSNKHFIICVPHSVFESLDMMKDTDAEAADAAKECYSWMDEATKKDSPGIRILKNTEKKRLNIEYPDETKNIEMWEYLDMLECCHYLMSTTFEGNPYQYVHSAFQDHRDNYSVFFLSGNDTLLNASVSKGFDPIKIARSLPGVFVDCILEYPPTQPRHRARSPVRRRGKKYKTSGKCKG